MGSSNGGQGGFTDTAKRLAGRSLLAAASGLGHALRGAGGVVAKGVNALTADSGDKEAVRCLKFALLEWGGATEEEAGATSCAGACCGSGRPSQHRLPVLLVGLDTGFQVWRLDGDNPAELLSRRDGPAKILEVLPEPRFGDAEPSQDELRGARPLLAVVPAPERALLPPSAQQAQQAQQQHSVQLYSLRSQGFVRSLSFGGEVLGVAASGRLLIVALRGQIQAFDACTLLHTFSCVTYVPPTPPPPPASPTARQRSAHTQQQPQFITAGLTSSASSSAASDPGSVAQQQQPGLPTPQAAALAPFALGPRWLAYAADTPVPQSSSQAVAQRLPLSRQDSHHSAASGLESEGSVGAALGTSPSGRNASVLTTAVVADAARAAAAKGGQHLKAGLSAVGTASYRYLSQQYSSWRQGGQQLQQRDVDALEADAAVAGTVVVRDATTRLVVAHFRPHTSPLAALQFSPGGTLLATASVAGHSINLFHIAPPPLASGAGGDAPGGSTGHAVWLYRLYRGVTPAAICGISFAPDASWVAISSGRGTTHLFHTPAGSPGGRQLDAAQLAGAAGQAGGAGDAGVVGRPPKLAPVGRARKPGLLGGGVAGAATSAARQLYSGQPADSAPIAAAFLVASPGSPRGTAAVASLAGEGSAPSSSLYVVTQDGLLTRHLLRAPAAGAEGSGAGSAPASPSPSSPLQFDRQEPALGAAGAAAGAPPLLEEMDRWDVARHVSWPEREELLPGLLPAPGGADLAAPAAAADAGETGAAQQQVWVAQAEAGALAGPGGTGAAAAPLWGDPQFRFFELRVQQLQRQRSASSGAANGAPTEAAGPYGSPAAEWLENLPAEPIQHQQ